MRDPVRTLKRAAPLAVGSVTIVYLLVNIAYFVVVPLEEIRGGGRIVAYVRLVVRASNANFLNAFAVVHCSLDIFFVQVRRG